MILGNQAIRQAIADGRIIHDGPDEPGTSSIDVRIGRDAWVLRPHGWCEVRDVYRPQSWDWEPVRVQTAGSLRRTPRFAQWALGVVHDDAEVIALDSDQLYLCTTEHAIGTAPGSGIVPTMHARSTWGRNGLTVALCAGVGDVGYSGRWALEVHNLGGGIVPIAVGTRVGQVIFHEVAGCDQAYGGAERYQDAGDVRFLPKGLGWSR